MNKDPAPTDPPDETEFWEALARYVAGESPPEEADRIRRWLAEKPEHSALVQSLDAALGRLSANAGADIDVEAALRAVKARFKEPKVYQHPAARYVPQEQSGRRWRTTLVRVAAAVVVVLGVSLIWRAAQQREVPLAAAATYTTGVGQTDSLRLPDGTRVVLGPYSTLALGDSYGEPARAVELNGEAFFDVEHDEARPFSVRAGGATIRDLGTSFAVRSSGTAVRVAVTVGAVVLHRSDTREAAGVLLSAGDRGVLEPGGAVRKEQGSVTADDVAFARGRLVFDNATLEEVAIELRRWYGIELRVADAALANRHLTAAFEQDPLAQVLNVIALALGASIEQKGDTAFVRISR